MEINKIYTVHIVLYSNYGLDFYGVATISTSDKIVNLNGSIQQNAIPLGTLVYSETEDYQNEFVLLDNLSEYYDLCDKFYKSLTEEIVLKFKS